jgi:hypothetical protein
METLCADTFATSCQSERRKIGKECDTKVFQRKTFVQYFSLVSGGEPGPYAGGV